MSNPETREVDVSSLREAIQEEYQLVAQEPDRGFHFHTGRPLTRILGYSSEWLDAKFGFGRGFDHYEMVPHQGTYAGRIVRRALQIIDGRSPRDQPLFFFLNNNDPHDEILGHKPYRLPDI